MSACFDVVPPCEVKICQCCFKACFLQHYGRDYRKATGQTSQALSKKALCKTKGQEILFLRLAVVEGFFWSIV